MYSWIRIMALRSDLMSASRLTCWKASAPVENAQVAQNCKSIRVIHYSGAPGLNAFCVRFKGEHVDVSLIASEKVVVFRLGKQVSWQEATDSVSM